MSLLDAVNEIMRRPLPLSQRLDLMHAAEREDAQRVLAATQAANVAVLSRPSGSNVAALLSPNATISSPSVSPSAAVAPLEPLPPAVELETYGQKNDSGGERRMAGENGGRYGRQAPDEWDIIDWSRKKPRVQKGRRQQPKKRRSKKTHFKR